MALIRRDRACAAVGWCAILACLLVATSWAQPLGGTRGAAAGGAAGAKRAAECSLYLLGGEGRILRAGMRCTGPPGSTPSIVLSPHLAAYRKNFTGVTIFKNDCPDRRCYTDTTKRCSTDTTIFLVTICAGKFVLRSSSVSGVPALPPLHGVLCAVGNSSLDIHHSHFTENRVRVLGVFDGVQLLLNASTISGNSHKGTAGGVWIEMGANVIITGRSRVHGNRATDNGGGLLVKHDATLTVDGDSSVDGNSAGQMGGGLAAVHRAHIIITGGSSVHDNTAGELGGGLFVLNKAVVTVTNGSSVVSNSAMGGSGGGMDVSRGARVTISNRSIVSKNRCPSGPGGGISVDVARRIEFDPDGRVVDVQQHPRAPVADVEDEDPAKDVPSSVMISNSTVSNNTSIRSAGGGVAVGGSATVVLVKGAMLMNNQAVHSSGGGVVLLTSGVLSADDTVVCVNNGVSEGYVGTSIAAFGNSTLRLPPYGQLSRCSVDVHLGMSNCQAGETRRNAMCLCCPQHTFSFTVGSCQPCPRNGNCSGGGVVQPLPGFWSSAPTSVQMHRCPLSTTACNYTGPAHECNEGYTGPLCGVCQLPQYGMLGAFRCGKCMQPNVQLGLYLLLSFVSVLFVAFTVHATWRDNLTGTHEVLATDVIKVLVQFLQYIVIIGSVSVPWPLFDMQRWFQAVNIVFAAVGSGQALSLDCWLHHYIPQDKLVLPMQRQLVYFVAPVFALLAVVALQLLTWAFRRWVVPLVLRSKGTNQQRHPVSVVRKFPVTLLVLTYYAYPILLRASLSFFACMRIDRLPPYAEPPPPGATAPLSYTWGYWVSDIQQECFSGYHKGWALGLGLPSVMLWCIAVPVAMGLGLFLCRAKADEDTFREHFGFLYRSYRPERMWWEAVWAARTVVLTLVSVFAYPMERYFSVLSLLVVFWASAALQNMCQPYAFPTLHTLHMVSTSCLAATTLGALAMFAYDLDESTAKGVRIAIAALLLLVNMAFVGYCVWKLAPFVPGLCVKVYKLVKSWVLWVVEAVLLCTGHSSGGQGKGRRRRRG